MEKDVLCPVLHQKTLSYRVSIINIKSMICWRTALGLVGYLSSPVPVGFVVIVSFLSHHF